MTSRQYDQVALRVFGDRASMGAHAAKAAAACLREALAQKQALNCVFAAAPSQNEFLDALCAEPGIEWGRVNAFHMDEYIGAGPGDGYSFAAYLSEQLFGRLPLKSVNLINGAAADPKEECARYAALLEEHPTDVVFMGIGENGHIAFNDPGIADFADPFRVRAVDLDMACRLQQVNDGCFAALEEVPKRALTLTVPQLMSAEKVFCIVPGERKAQAVCNTLTGPVDEACPASILRRHKNIVEMYADAPGAAILLEQEA